MTVETRIDKDRLSPYDYVIRGREVPEELKNIALNELKKLSGSRYSSVVDNDSESKKLFPELAGKNNNPWYK